MVRETINQRGAEKLRERVLVLGDDDFISLIDFQCLAAVDVEGEIEALRVGGDLAVQMVREDAIVPGVLTAEKFQPWESTPEESAGKVSEFLESVLETGHRLLPGDLCWLGVPTRSLTTVDLLLGRIAPGEDGVAVRIVDTEEELREIFDSLSANGTDVTPSGYVGKLLQQPDKTVIGWRTKARRDRQPVIDIYTLSNSGARVYVEPPRKNKYEYIIGWADDDYIDLTTFTSAESREIDKGVEDIEFHGKKIPIQKGILLLAGEYAAKLIINKIITPGYVRKNDFYPWSTPPEESARRIIEFANSLERERDLLFGEPCWFDLPSNTPDWKEPCHPDNYPPWKVEDTEQNKENET